MLKIAATLLALAYSLTCYIQHHHKFCPCFFLGLTVVVYLSWDGTRVAAIMPQAGL